MGSPNKFGWLTEENVTFLSKVTEILSHIPAVLRTLLLLVRFAQPAEVRLRASLSVQDDIQRAIHSMNFGR